MSGSSDAPPPFPVPAVPGIDAPAQFASPLPARRSPLGPITITFKGSPDPASEVLGQRGVSPDGDSLVPNPDAIIVAYDNAKLPVGVPIPNDHHPRARVVSRQMVFIGDDDHNHLIIDTGYADGTHVFFGRGGPFTRDDEGRLHMSRHAEDRRPKAYLVRAPDDYGWEHAVVLPPDSQRYTAADLYARLEPQWARWLAMNRSDASNNGGNDDLIDRDRACHAAAREPITDYNWCVVGDLVPEGKHGLPLAFERFLMALPAVEQDTWLLAVGVDRVRWDRYFDGPQWPGGYFGEGGWVDPDSFTHVNSADRSRRRPDDSVRNR